MPLMLPAATGLQAHRSAHSGTASSRRPARRRRCASARHRPRRPWPSEAGRPASRARRSPSPRALRCSMASSTTRGGEIHGAGDLDDDVDLAAARQHLRIVGEHGHAARDALHRPRRRCRRSATRGCRPRGTHARRARVCGWRCPPAACPATGVPSCSAIARPVAPAPTTPTRIGRCAASRVCSRL